MKGNQDPAELAEHVWRHYLTTGDFPADIWPYPLVSFENYRRLMHVLPSDPRCSLCSVPFEGMGGRVVRAVLGRTRSRMNPMWCNACEQFAEAFPGGAEVELTMLFADVRGSTSLAEGRSPAEFSQLIDRFYRATSDVLIRSQAIIEKLIGDEVAGLYVPGMTPQHAQVAVEAAKKVLRATGYGTPEGAWIPVGAGVHTGVAFVGSVGSPDGVVTITALGDAVNTAARLASTAGPGEILVSEATREAAGLVLNGAETRELQLKGRSEPLKVFVLRPT